MNRAVLYRTRARLIVAAGGDPSEAEVWHQRGLDVAVNSGVPLLQLEAATGVAEHLVATGRAGEARDLLAPIVARFTEGAGTVPMSAAHAALAAAQASAR